MGHFVRFYPVIYQDIVSVHHIVTICVIWHPGHTYRGFGSAF
jgi:hypothetical protein